MFLRVMRTLKLVSPQVNEMKFRVQFIFRYLFSIPHEEHFRILKYFDPKFFKNKCLVDVGGNRGQTIQSLRLYSDAFVVCFEPQKSMAKLIECRRFNDCKVIDLALGSNCKKMNIFVPIYRGIVFDGLASSSEVEARKFFNSSRFFFFDESRLFISKSTIERRTLDSFDFSPALIKVDVQGAELDVLKGAASTIAHHKPIIFIERPEPNKETKFLNTFGYEGYVWEKNRLYKRSHGYNVIFLTKDHLSLIKENVRLWGGC